MKRIGKKMRILGILFTLILIESCNKGQSSKNGMYRLTRVQDAQFLNKPKRVIEPLSDDLLVTWVDNNLDDLKVPEKLKNHSTKLSKDFPAPQFFQNLHWYLPRKRKITLESTIYFHGAKANKSLLYDEKIVKTEIDRENRKMLLYSSSNINQRDQYDHIYTIEWKPFFGKEGLVEHEMESGSLLLEISQDLIGQGWSFQTGFTPYNNPKETGKDFWTENISLKNKHTRKNPIITCRAMHTNAVQKGLVQVFDSILFNLLKGLRKFQILKTLQLWENSQHPYNHQILFMYPKPKVRKKTNDNIQERTKSKLANSSLKQLTGFTFTKITPNSIVTYMPNKSRKLYDSLKSNQQNHNKKVDEMIQTIRSREKNFNKPKNINLLTDTIHSDFEDETKEPELLDFSNNNNTSDPYSFQDLFDDFTTPKNTDEVKTNDNTPILKIINKPLDVKGTKGSKPMSDKTQENQQVKSIKTLNNSKSNKQQKQVKTIETPKISGKSKAIKKVKKVKTQRINNNEKDTKRPKKKDPKVSRLSSNNPKETPTPESSQKLEENNNTETKNLKGESHSVGE